MALNSTCSLPTISVLGISTGFSLFLMNVTTSVFDELNFKHAVRPYMPTGGGGLPLSL